MSDVEVEVKTAKELLQEKVDDCYKTGRWFVAVVKFDPNAGPDSLQMFYSQQNFPTEELIPSLKKIENMVIERTGAANVKPGENLIKQ